MGTVRILARLTLLCALLLPALSARAQPAARFFPETGHTVAGAFLAYWDANGSLAQFGYPLSDEFSETSALDGQPHTVQYFERALFEHHPEYAGSPFAVELAQLGRYQDTARHGTLVIPAPLREGFVQDSPQGSNT